MYIMTLPSCLGCRGLCRFTCTPCAAKHGSPSHHAWVFGAAHYLIVVRGRTVCLAYAVADCTVEIVVWARWGHRGRRTECCAGQPGAALRLARMLHCSFLFGFFSSYLLELISRLRLQSWRCWWVSEDPTAAPWLQTLRSWNL